MAKTYTAQEIREMANKLPDDYSFADIVSGDGDKQLFSMGCLSSMLRQAADALERVKKWEYAVMFTALNGRRCISPGRAHCIAASKNILSLYTDREKANIVRREVGEREEVKR